MASPIASALLTPHSELSHLPDDGKPIGCARCGEERSTALRALHAHKPSEPAVNIRDYHWSCADCLKKEIDRTASSTNSNYSVDDRAKTVYFNCVACAMPVAAPLSTVMRATATEATRGPAHLSITDSTPATDRMRLRGAPILPFTGV